MNVIPDEVRRPAGAVRQAVANEHASLPEAPDGDIEALIQALHRLDAAEAVDQPPAVLVLALTQVGRCYRTLSEPATALWYLQQALRKARALAAPEACIELLCDLSELSCENADEADPADPRSGHAARERARDQAYEAARLAGEAGDPDWEVNVLSRVGTVLERCGDADDAQAVWQHAQALRAGAQRLLPAIGGVRRAAQGARHW